MSKIAFLFLIIKTKLIYSFCECSWRCITNVDTNHSSARYRGCIGLNKRLEYFLFAVFCHDRKCKLAGGVCWGDAHNKILHLLPCKSCDRYWCRMLCQSAAHDFLIVYLGGQGVSFYIGSVSVCSTVVASVSVGWIGRTQNCSAAFQFTGELFIWSVKTLQLLMVSFYC